MNDVHSQIEEMVHRETRAWNALDAEALVNLFHPDMVWPWPPTEHAHDPIEWVMVLGRYDRTRWMKLWQGLFDTHELIRNDRVIRKVVISEQGDGAFAVVDIDTLWRDRTGKEMNWKGRVCKVYSKVGKEWKMTMHNGVLKY